MTTPLQGLMQDRPLLIASLLTHGATFNGPREIVSRLPGSLARFTFAQAEVRARRLAKGLERLGLRPGDRLASLAWNTHRHFELFYGVPGMGAVLHTLNPRLWEEQLVYIAGHAEDRVLFFDPDLLGLVVRLAPKLPSVEHYVLLGGRDELPAELPFPVIAYEDLLADDDYRWPEFDERTAALLCYTSGTTGMPKGVLSSHRSTVLHTLYSQSANAFGLTPFDSVLLVVPMFHAQGWGLPFSCAIAGAKLVLPGAAPDPRTVVDLLHAEGATLAMGVPTVWTGVFDELDRSGRDLGPLKRALIGGSAVPPAMSQRLRGQYGVAVVTGWGMTELSPLGSFTGSTPEIEALPAERHEAALHGRAGRMLYPVEIRVLGPDGAVLPHDGVSAGDIQVRGPCVASGYYRGEGGDVLTDDGWFPTGDVGTVDEHGAVAITDRLKDLIKSGGEWISSTDLEKAACDTPGVAQAAAIAVPHPRWQERPLMLVTASPGVRLDPGAVLETMRRTLARWQLPDDVVVVDELPLTATGKIDKKALRARHQDHLAGLATGSLEESA
ncbi:MAG TPA: long-chain fatty acid--CoA ligase [Caulobacter sp.]|nr:long-chain fatty acid--CoA ligase [Caulobacter sp.]